jgi:hypothetical protein
MIKKLDAIIASYQELVEKIRELKMLRAKIKEVKAIPSHIQSIDDVYKRNWSAKIDCCWCGEEYYEWDQYIVKYSMDRYNGDSYVAVCPDCAKEAKKRIP